MRGRTMKKLSAATNALLVLVAVSAVTLQACGGGGGGRPRGITLQEPCSTDDDCAAGESCNPVVLICTECTYDVDCVGDESCVDGVCTDPSSTICTSDDECSPGQSCVDGVCTDPDPSICTSDDMCPLDEACTDGSCGPGECDLHLGIGCSDGYYCSYHGHCVSSG